MPGERLADLRERGPPPQRERRAQQLGRLCWAPRRERCAAALRELGERRQVERVPGQVDDVARRLRTKQPLRQLLAELRDEDLHHLLRALGRLVAPEVVDELSDRHDAAGVQEQQREQRLLLPAAQLNARHVERLEDPELHVVDYPGPSAT